LAKERSANRKNDITTYPTLTKLVDHVKSLPYRSESYFGGQDNEWYGGTWEDTYRLVEHGWSEGAAKAAKMAMRIADRTVEHTAASMHREVVYDVVGAAYDPGAYMAGIPECWLSFQPYEDKRGIHFVVNVAVSCGVSTEVFERRGIALSALAIALHSRGHAITIDVADVLKPGAGLFGGNSNGDYETIQFRVADATSGSPLDLDRIVYSLAHPTVFRRIFSAATNGFRGITGGTRWGNSGVPFIGETIKGFEHADLFLGAGQQKMYDLSGV
jgi:hypothetical protein